jgi:hypothetical protein
MKNKITNNSTALSMQTNETKPPVAALSAAPTINEEQVQAQIRELAFQLYKQRGHVDGFAERDWLEAEAIIRQHGKIAA